MLYNCNLIDVWRLYVVRDVIALGGNAMPCPSRPLPIRSEHSQNNDVIRVRYVLSDDFVRK